MFCNPPYGKEVPKWVHKAYESVREPGTVVVMLLPARTDTRWFQEWIYHRAEVRFLCGRVKFELNGVAQSAAPFPSMVVVFRAGGER